MGLRTLVIVNPKSANGGTGRRWPEIKARVTGIDLLNRASMAGAPVLRDLRARTLKCLYAVTPVRKTLMKAGLGLRPGQSG